MKPIVVKNFVSKQACDELNAWTELGIKKRWLDYGITFIGGLPVWGYTKRLNTRICEDQFEYPAIAYEIFSKITATLGLEDLPKSVQGRCKNGIVVSCTLPSGSVFEHTDPKEPYGELLRCNVITKNSDFGGNLYIGGEHLDIGVGDLHCYLASYTPHYVTPVEGNTARVLWMFGYQTSIVRYTQIKVA